MKGKSPAILFYTSDFLTGIITLNFEQRGRYITLLCLQHQKGHLSEKTLNEISNSDAEIISKFCKDKQGFFYNKRLELEIIKRDKYCNSRGKNKLEGHHKKIISKSYDKHMENDNDNENVNEILSDSELLINIPFCEKFKNEPKFIKSVNAYFKVREKKNLLNTIYVWEVINQNLKEFSRENVKYAIKLLENAIVGEWNQIYDMKEEEKIKFPTGKTKLVL